MRFEVDNTPGKVESYVNTIDLMIPMTTEALEACMRAVLATQYRLIDFLTSHTACIHRPHTLPQRSQNKISSTTSFQTTPSTNLKILK